MNTTSILIAAVGVIGTLVSPIISQRLASRAKRDDLEIERSHRLDERQQEQRQLALANKRACYIAMVTTSRRYRIEIINYLDKIRRATLDAAARDELENARRPYIESNAEAQLTATLSVLNTIEAVTDGLSKAYRATKHLEDGEPEPGGSFEEMEAFLVEIWDRWKYMREAMRQDLGVED
jgi:hypothetical protein